MARYVVTAAGVVAWFAAIGIIVRLRNTVRTPAPTADAASWDALRASLARFAGSLCGALVAGLLVLGLVFRLVMRLVASTSPRSVQGTLTDAERPVGTATFGGTVAVLVFVGIIGSLFAVAVFGLVRRWLPDRSVWAGLSVAAIAAAPVVRPTGTLAPGSRDFSILGPRWLAVSLVLAMLATFAALGAVLIDRWAARWPLPALSTRGIVAYLPFVPFLLVGPAAAAVVASVAFSCLLRPRLLRWHRLGAADRVGRAVVSAGTAAGVVWLGFTAAQIVL